MVGGMIIQNNVILYNNLLIA